jgi:hypothetical protein
MKKICSISLFFILLLITPVFAAIDIVTYPATDGFSLVAGSTSVELCYEESVIDSFVVRNTGQYASIFSIALSASKMVSVSESSFELLPGKEKTVFIYAQAAHKDFSETVFFEVGDIFGNKKSFEKTFVVGRCQNLEASLLFNEVLPIDPCSPVIYEVLVHNIGSYTETYLVDFGGDAFAEYFGTPYQSLVISAGQSGIASSSLSLPCRMSGDMIIPFRVHAQKNDLDARLTHVLSVDPAYDFTASLDYEHIVCRDKMDTFFMTIQNNAPFTNNFTLTFVGPDFITLKSSTLELASGASSVVELTAGGSNASLGDYAFTIIVTDATAGWTQSFVGNVSLVDCYGVSVNIDMQEDISACAGYHEYPVIVQNTGLIAEDIMLSVDGSFASLRDEEFSLAPGESKASLVVLDVPRDESVDEVLTVSGAIMGSSVLTKDTIKVSLLDASACHEPVIAIPRVDEKVSAAEVIFDVKNLGRAQSYYKVSFAGASWLSLASESEEIVLAPGESAPLTLLLYQDESAVQKYYGGVFRIVVSDAAGDIEYFLPVDIVMHDKSFVVKSFEYFSAHPCQFASLLLFLFIIIGILVIIARSADGRERTRGVLPVLLLAWLVAVIIVIFLQGGIAPLYEPVLQNPDDALTIRVAEDESYVLDISSFFVDPDGDSMRFSVSAMDNVSVIETNGSALFVPDSDWSGSRRFRITALDSSDCVTESPRLVLEVVDRPEYSWWDLYVHYCACVNLVLLLILAFIIDLLAMVRKEKEDISLPPTKKKQRRMKRRAA